MNATQLSFPRTLLPEVSGLEFEDARFANEEMVAVLRSTAPSVACPVCGASSSSIHSHYKRTPDDLPWAEHRVKLILCVRKFFCRVPSCERRIFTERLPEVVAPWARTTERLTMLLRAIAFALGGEAGVRLAKRLGLPVSAATLISLIRKTPLPEPPPAHVLGVDDWAHRKGISYGTALVDLESHRLIELLEDRESETLAHWLQANPGTEVISRDRSEKYAAGGREGAPKAVQVADRWHLISNWREAAQRIFERHRGSIKRIILPSSGSVDKPDSAVSETTRTNTQHDHDQEKPNRSQAKRRARYEMIRERYSKGEYLNAIARDLGLDYRTVRKYALSDECPTRKPYPKRGRMIDPYESYIRARFEEGCKNGVQLHREIVEMGYPGSRSQVAPLVAQLRREENGGNPQSPSPSKTGEPLTPRKASMLLLRREEHRSEEESTALSKLPEAHQDIATVISFTERFVMLIRERRGGELAPWLSDAEASDVGEIRQFARRIRQDEDAVRAGCTLDYSNGPTEGKITKLKLLKRQMYGRAKFDLLRRRALYAA